MKIKKGVSEVYSANPYWDLFCEGHLDPHKYLEDEFEVEDVEKAIGIVEGYILALVREGTLVVV